MRSRLVRYLGLLTVAALAVGMLAGPASAKKLTPKQKAKVAKQLRKQIKKNPKAIKSKSFLKRAALVNFKLPVTLALRTGDIAASTTVDESATRNTNKAMVDLGASLGQREVNLGGKLAGEITFQDSYDGGALGNVKIDILPSSTKQLTSTSIPLLWNTQVTDPATRWDANALALGIPSLEEEAGCGNFTGTNMTFGAPYISAAGVFVGAGQPGAVGYPLHTATSALGGDGIGGNAEGFLPVTAGIDNPNSLKAEKNPNDPMALGGNATPFPTGDAPGGFTQPPSVKDTVLRTAPLKLNVASPGTPVDQTGTVNADGVSGSQNITIGKSGGEANLFGNIPGKAYGIDVTVSLATKINSILRIVDQDAWGAPLVMTQPWPAGVFGCRQVYTGAIQNYIPGVRLKGSLKISPGINANGDLRIAKATVSSSAPARFAVAACLMPNSAFQKHNGAAYNANLPVPSSPNTPALEPTTVLPVDTSTYEQPPTAECNDAPDKLVADSGLAVGGVSPLGAVTGDGYTVTNSGAAVTVGADLDVTNVALDVLIGDV